jgi:hypothetical protein
MSYLKNKMNLTKRVDVKLTPDDWDLYTDQPEVERVAEYLNERFNDYVNAGWSRKLVEQSMLKDMKLYRGWGAYDTEPLSVLAIMLDEVYE